jgi:hypothetical protein
MRTQLRREHEEAVRRSIGEALAAQKEAAGPGNWGRCALGMSHRQARRYLRAYYGPQEPGRGKDGRNRVGYVLLLARRLYGRHRFGWPTFLRELAAEFQVKSRRTAYRYMRSAQDALAQDWRPEEKFLTSATRVVAAKVEKWKEVRGANPAKLRQLAHEGDAAACMHLLCEAEPERWKMPGSAPLSFNAAGPQSSLARARLLLRGEKGANAPR